MKKIINKIQNKPEKEKVMIMWILVIFCMLIMIGVWKISLDLKKPTEINSNNYSNLNLPPFPELEELNKEIGSLEKLNEEELEENKIEENIEN